MKVVGEHFERLEAAVSTPYDFPRERFNGRGIVIAAGGPKYFACAWACAWILREVGCRLPIEFWYLDRMEMDPEMISAAAMEGIRCINARQLAQQLPNPPRILNGWELKPFAVIHSGFAEVLYLDADQIPADDPSYLFECKGYQDHGAMFWPDLPPWDRSEWLPPEAWRLVGLDYRDEVDFETGQFVVNKERCWRELHVCMHLNDWSDYYYNHLYGDKSTFHLAWRKCGTDYAMPDAPPIWEHPVILQHDQAGKRIFQHATRGKDAIVHAHSLEHLANFRVVYEAASELKARWNGNVWSASAQNLEETTCANSLLGSYHYERIGLDGRELQLLSRGRVGRGAARCEKRWSLRQIDNIPTLVIVGEWINSSEIAMMFLVEQNSGTWVGSWTEYERCSVLVERA